MSSVDIVHSQAASDHLNDLHYNGVHLRCKTKGTKRGDGSHRDCPKAGKVSSIHGHDYDGPLICCDEVAP